MGENLWPKFQLSGDDSDIMMTVAVML